VHFISLSPAPEYGVPTYNVGFGSKYSATRGKWKYPISMLRARSLVRKLKPDIVNTHYATSGGLTGLVCDFHPTITTVHGSDLNLSLESRVWRPLLKVIFNHADCVNACCEDLKRKVVSLGISPGKICVVTPGIDTKQFSFVPKEKVHPKRPLRLVSTRYLKWIYDHSTIIKALSILRSRGVVFEMTFVAGGPLLGALKRQVEHEQLTDCVHFFGGVDKRKIIDILHNHDVFLSSALYDGISVALLEAMATGLFPIVSNLRVNSDWLEDGVDGLLHKVGDADDLARCILKARDNPKLMVEAVRRNREKVVKSGDTKKNMELLEGIYADLLHKTRTGTI